MSDTDPDSVQPGWITRARSLREIFPVVALGDALSPASSILCLLLTVAALAVTDWLADAFGVPLLSGFAGRGIFAGSWRDPQVPLESVAAAASFVQHPLAAFVTSLGQFSIWIAILCQLALLLLWFVPLGLVLRQSALAIAGRHRMSFSGAARFVLGRWHAMLIGPLIPLVGAALMWIACLGVIAICDAILPHDVGSIVAAILCVPFVALGGLLLGGLVLALPLVWAAAVVEQDADAFDSISRAFEYLFQRPLRYIVYLLAAAFLWLIAVWIARFLLGAGVAVYADATWRAAGFGAAAVGVAEYLLRAFGLNLFWAFAAGVYLLVRRDQNHRELEDVWEPPVNVQPLPELPETLE